MTSFAVTQTERPGAAPFIEKRPLEACAAPAQPSLVGMTREALAAALGEAGVPERQRRMRVQQIWHWLYVRGAQDFDAMTTLSKELRTALAQRFTLARPDIAAEQISVDGTRKWLLRLLGEAGSAPHEVECVYIPETDRGTLCISSQVGCTLTCTFCHTGTQRLVRNLTAAEIAGQVVLARDRLNDWQRGTSAAGEPEKRLVSNVVMMGMGEPLYNFEAVRDGLAVVADGDGLSISKRRITLSTSGVVPNIARAGAEIGTMLAVSLHAVTDELRDQLVPLNRKYPLRELLDACRTQWENMPRARQVRSRRFRINRRADGMRAVGGRDAGGHTLAGFNRLGKRRAKARGVLLGHRKEAQIVGALLGQRQADQPAAKAGHEVDGFWSHKLGG